MKTASMFALWLFGCFSAFAGRQPIDYVDHFLGSSKFHWMLNREESVSKKQLYAIDSLVFPKFISDQGGKYQNGKSFTIEATNAWDKIKCTLSAALDGMPLTRLCFYRPSHQADGGRLVLIIRPQSSMQQGSRLADAPPPKFSAKEPL